MYVNDLINVFLNDFKFDNETLKKTCLIVQSLTFNLTLI